MKKRRCRRRGLCPPRTPRSLPLWQSPAGRCSKSKRIGEERIRASRAFTERRCHAVLPVISDLTPFQRQRHSSSSPPPLAGDCPCAKLLGVRGAEPPASALLYSASSTNPEDQRG